MASRPDGVIRAFGMSGLQISSDLARVEREYAVELGHDARGPKGRKTADYEQFESTLRAEAARMSEFYEIFYCLENSIRTLVADTLLEADGADWWNGGRVDEKRIREPAVGRRKKEVDSGITPRSERLIDYTTFGGTIPTDN